MAAETGTALRAKFLLCRPLGQEAVRTAAIYRVVADRLAREGGETLRFDYHGTGDSPGDEGDQSIAQWVDDVLDAHASLEQGGQAPVHWFGMGLGANIALRAALRAKAPPAQLVLWEPVFNGKAYVQALKDGHCAELVRMFRVPWERLLSSGKAVQPQLPGNLLGFEFGPKLSEDLQEMGDINLLPALRRGIRVVCAVHAEQRPMFETMGAQALFHLHTVETRTDWMSSQAMGTAIAPPDIPRTLISTLS
ncbi:alpha/beta fold hydrolase [Hydrogenophaga sp. BPS33]|uniref:alpha/beta fold hydrolase n=1 Tax=Hydrogenophaga sp. BPS33 TaxID=2651974 RepID=UPI00135BDB27|nr:alpha/beta fold hydrolase [Hydrogenophaga sp. BPS33]